VVVVGGGGGGGKKVEGRKETRVGSRYLRQLRTELKSVFSIYGILIAFLFHAAKYCQSSQNASEIRSTKFNTTSRMIRPRIYK
jgi:hypothetical protein